MILSYDGITTLTALVEMTIARNLAAGEPCDVRQALAEIDHEIEELRRRALARPATGFGLQCPYCFALEQDLALNLNDLSSVTCLNCVETFSPRKARQAVRAVLEPWEDLVRWLERTGAELAAVSS